METKRILTVITPLRNRKEVYLCICQVKEVSEVERVDLIETSQWGLFKYEITYYSQYKEGTIREKFSECAGEYMDAVIQEESK